MCRDQREKKYDENEREKEIKEHETKKLVEVGSWKNNFLYMYNIHKTILTLPPTDFFYL